MFSLVLLGLAAQPQVAHAQTTAITSIVSPQTSASGDYSLGWEFTVNSPITVTELGVFDDFGDGLISGHQVGIFRVSDQSLLVSTIVGTADPLDGIFRYANVPSTLLTTGESYRIAALYTNSGDPYQFDATSFSTAPEINFVGERFADSTTLVFPNTNAGGGINGYFSANFKVGVAAPEPTALAFLALGAVGGLITRRRK